LSYWSGGCEQRGKRDDYGQGDENQHGPDDQYPARGFCPVIGGGGYLPGAQCLQPAVGEEDEIGQHGLGEGYLAESTRTENPGQIEGNDKSHNGFAGCSREQPRKIAEEPGPESGDKVALSE